MQVAGQVRRAAQSTLADIEPTAFATELQELIERSSVVPGVVTVRTAEHLGGTSAGYDALEQAVGIQISYEGLRLTRSLIRNEDRYAVADPTPSYLALVEAEVLVARGFEELADSPVAGKAIDIVQRFAKNQTEEYDRPAGIQRGQSLEYDVILLAVMAGATSVVGHVPPSIQEFGTNLAEELDHEPFPPVDDVDRRLMATLDASIPSDDAVMVND